MPKARKAVDLPAVLDDRFWSDEERELLAVLLPLIEQGAMGGVDAQARAIEAMGIGVDWTQPHTEAATWARRYGGKLIRGVTRTTRDRVGVTVGNWVETPGANLHDLWTKLQSDHGFSEARSKLIAITETTSAFSRGEMAAAAAVEKEGLFELDKFWNTNRDEVVCLAICEPMHGQSVRGSKTDFTLPNGQKVKGPPAHPGCILPGQEVVTFGPISAAAESFYRGPCVEITFDDGRILAVTENHPILTPKGWIAAKLLREGDEILTAPGAERIAASIEPDHDHGPTVIEEVVRALVESGAVSTAGVPVAAEDFHGDGRFIDGNVNVVYADGLLLGDIKARLLQLLGKFRLDGHNADTLPLSSQGILAPLGTGSLPPLGGGIGGSGLALSLGGGRAFPFELFGLRATTGGDASGQEAAAEGPAIDASLAGQLVFRFASDIATEQIVKVRNFDFAGHVYDLQSELYELYTVNRVLVKNCRCWLSTLPVWQEEAGEEIIEELPPLGEFKTLEQATTWAKQNYPDIEWDFTGAHVDTINPTLQQWDKLAKEYPVVARRIEFFGTGQGEGAGMALEWEYGTYAHAADKSIHKGKTRIGLNPHWFGKPVSFQRSRQEGVEMDYRGDKKIGRWHPLGSDSIESCITHEFGHQVEFWLQAQKGVAFDEVVGLDGYGSVTDTLWFWRQKNKPNALSLSRYATTNEREAFAEAFAAIYHMPTSKQPVFVKRFEKLLDLIANPSEWRLPGEWVWADDIPDLERRKELLRKQRKQKEAINW